MPAFQTTIEKGQGKENMRHDPLATKSGTRGRLASSSTVD